MLPQYMTKELYKKFSCCFNKSLESPAFPSSPYKKRKQWKIKNKKTHQPPSWHKNKKIFIIGRVSCIVPEYCIYIKKILYLPVVKIWQKLKNSINVSFFLNLLDCSFQSFSDSTFPFLMQRYTEGTG